MAVRCRYLHCLRLFVAVAPLLSALTVATTCYISLRFQRQAKSVDVLSDCRNRYDGLISEGAKLDSACAAFVRHRLTRDRSCCLSYRAGM